MRTRPLVGELSLRAAVTGCLILGAAGGASTADHPNALCATCHEARVVEFARTVHGKAAHYGEAATCESCHAGGSEHARTGDPDRVIDPDELDADRASAVCLSCHSADRERTFWSGSVHERQQVGCVTCHDVHTDRDRLLAKADEKETCLSCHFEVRADLFKRSRHPLRDSSRPTTTGKMTCSSCHNPHGGRSDPLIDAKSINDKCYECHFEKRAPVLWEHSPVKEDCLICHDAHGSLNDKLLVTKVPRLCQECHMQGRHQSGTFAPTSVFLFNRGCLHCHPQVHGSNNPSGAVLQR